MVKTEMRRITKLMKGISPRNLAIAGLFLAASLMSNMPAASAQEASAKIDVQHYSIDAQLVPSEQVLRAHANVVFIPAADTRSAVFELNGSLTVKKITRLTGGAAADSTSAPAPGANAPRPATARGTARPSANAGAKAPSGPAPSTSTSSPSAGGAELQFIQDNRENMNVRVDLG